MYSASTRAFGGAVVAVAKLVSAYPRHQTLELEYPAGTTPVLNEGGMLVARYTIVENSENKPSFGPLPLFRYSTTCGEMSPTSPVSSAWAIMSVRFHDSLVEEVQSSRLIGELVCRHCFDCLVSRSVV